MQVFRIISVVMVGGWMGGAFAQNAPGPAQTSPAPATPPIAAPSAPPVAPGRTNIASTNLTRTVSVDTRSISLQEAIDLALHHNFDIQIERFSPEIARYNLGAAYGAYDPNLFLSGQHSYSLSPGGVDAEGRSFGGNESEGDSFRGGLSGFLPWGMNYNLAASGSDNVVTSPDVQLIPDAGKPPTPIYATNALDPSNVFIIGYETNYLRQPIRTSVETTSTEAGFLTLSQPLLRNFWIDPTRASIKVAKNRLKYSEYGLRYQMITTILAVEQAYYNLIFARENVKVQEAAVELGERLVWENRKKVEVGQMAPLDEKQAESQVAASRADLLATLRAMDVQENTLKSLITDDYNKWHGVRVIPAENLIAVPALLNLQDSWEKALRLRPDLAQFRLDVERNDINLRLDRNQLFPQLDLVGQYGYRGRGTEWSGAIRDTDSPFWFYGAQLSYEIGNRTARNNYKTSKAIKEQSQLILKQREQAVMISVDDAVKLVQTDFARVEATREARLFAEAALDAEQKKLENGKSTNFEVLGLQRNLTAARFAEVQALAEYNNALAQLAFQEGSTFERHKLAVEVK